MEQEDQARQCQACLGYVPLDAKKCMHCGEVQRGGCLAVLGRICGAIIMAVIAAGISAAVDILVGPIAGWIVLILLIIPIINYLRG